MKKILFILFICCISSCDYNGPGQFVEKVTLKNSDKYKNKHFDIIEFEYNGHDYILFDDLCGKRKATGVVHNPECNCFKTN